MNAVIFDGREMAEKLEKDLIARFARLQKKTKLVSICNLEDPAGRMYTNIKLKKARELGVELTAYDLKSTNDWEGLISNLNKDERIDGIMLQLPLTGNRLRDIKLCLLIDPVKDVDGLNPRSGVVSATSRAVLKIMDQAFEVLDLDADGRQVAVVGSEGMVGRPLLRELKKDQRLMVYGMDKHDFDANILRQVDVVISCTGQERLIRQEMVKDPPSLEQLRRGERGVICIDVGYPHGDFDPEVVDKAAFLTPVPGGVGPVTVAMLFANLVDMVSQKS